MVKKESHCTCHVVRLPGKGESVKSMHTHTHAHAHTHREWPNLSYRQMEKKTKTLITQMFGIQTVATAAHLRQDVNSKSMNHTCFKTCWVSIFMDDRYGAIRKYDYNRGKKNNMNEMESCVWGHKRWVTQCKVTDMLWLIMVNYTLSHTCTQSIPI